jgi:TonB family protein
MNFRLFVALSCIALLQISFSAAHGQAKPPKEYVMYAPPPDYPAEARRLHLEGTGIYALHIRPDGTVESVAVAKSAGHVILDRAAAAAFIKWRYHPTGAKRVVTTPMDFTMRGYRGR